ncbi:MAG: DUF6326 family protein [Microcella sp.]|uniref:DUF6326 family protein n=1 Tax=Microcella sp. TaxID=1913979 RepID=UPI003314ED09
MTTTQTRPTRLDSTPLPVPLKIAAAWTSLMFLYVYVDIYGFFKPGVIDDILNGIVFEFDISATLLTSFLVLLAVPAMMVMLSTTLPARANRVTNLVVAGLYIPVTVFNAVGETWEWAAFYGLSIGLELFLLAAILRWAVTWPRVPTLPASAAIADGHDGRRPSA